MVSDIWSKKKGRDAPVARKGEKRRHSVPEQGGSRPQWAPGAKGGTAKRSEPVEEPQRRRKIGSIANARPIVIALSDNKRLDTNSRPFAIKPKP